MDPPQHMKYHRLVRSGFKPHRIATLESHVRELTHQIIDRVAHKGECDFVTAVAAELPLLVIAELMGVPLELHRNPSLLPTAVEFDELLRRLPDIELAAPPSRLRSNFINGIKEMRVRYTPESA